MKKISIDNGNSFVTVKEALETMEFDTIFSYMDDDAAERTHIKNAPCSEEEFVTKYLEIAPCDLIIG